MNLTINKISVEDFENLKDDWQILLHNSVEDRLFLSWHWHYVWWQTWHEVLNLNLLVLCAYDDGKLVGIAPLYSSREKIKSILTINRVQFLGNNWRGVATTRTEYLDFITKTEIHDEIVSAFIEYLNKYENFDEFVIKDIDKYSRTYQLLTENNVFNFKGIREVDEDKGTFIKIEGSFEDYIKGLGKNTRLKVFNRRKNLQSKGEISIRNVESQDLDDSFLLLNKLHGMRWNKQLFSDLDLQFHKRLSSLMLSEGKLYFSVLSVSGEPLSVLYNYRIDDYEYYMQSGFNQDYDKKIALGMLHLGFAIEQAFKDGMKTFDLLLGRGKHSYYKKHFSDCSRHVVTLQLLNRTKLSWLYKFYDLIKRH